MVTIKQIPKDNSLTASTNVISMKYPSTIPNTKMTLPQLVFFFRPTPPRLSPGRYTSFNLPEIELICMKSHKRELVWTFT